MKQDVPEQDLHSMLDVLLDAYTVQAVRPACHWWRCPRVLAWFRVRMVWSLVKPPAKAGPLSRIGDYLLAAQGPELLRRIRRRPTFPHERAATRGPPDPLFHRRPGSAPAVAPLPALLRPVVASLRGTCNCRKRPFKSDPGFFVVCATSVVLL